jgi:hypothetical protein
MPHRIMLKRLSAAVAVVALFAAASVPVSAQVKNQPAEKMQPVITQPTKPAQQPPQRTIMSIGGTYGPNGCDVNGQHYIINQTIDIEVREPGGKTHTVSVHCTSQGWST